jgi:hypothetical protein
MARDSNRSNFLNVLNLVDGKRIEGIILILVFRYGIISNVDAIAPSPGLSMLCK